MEKYMLPNESRESRIQILKNTADKIEPDSYYKRLTEEEIQEEQRQFTDNAIEIGKFDRDLKEAKDNHKAKVKPLKSNMAINLHHIKTEMREVHEDLYLISDQVEGTMGYYSGDGELIKTRPLTREERQLSIKFKQAE